MAETAAATAVGAPAAARPGGQPATPAKKGVTLPGNPTTWIIVLVFALAGGAYLLYRRDKASSAAAATGTSTSTGTSTGTDPDAAALGTLQSELGDLQSSESDTTTTTTTIAVPNVVGMMAGEADQYLDAIGLKGATTGIAATAKVTGQDPAAHSVVAKGTTVTLKAATTAATVKVPNVVGKTAGSADAAIDAAGLHGETTGIAATAKITSQSPAAGASVAKGTTVKLTAAKK
jgi:hypothetical protein